MLLRRTIRPTRPDAIMTSWHQTRTSWHHGLVADDRVPTAEVFLDERGSLLRVRWDEEAQKLIISIWRESTCVATHRLDHTDTTRLSSLLTQAWVDGLRRATTRAR